METSKHGKKTYEMPLCFVRILSSIVLKVTATKLDLHLIDVMGLK